MIIQGTTNKSQYALYVVVYDTYILQQGGVINSIRVQIAECEYGCRLTSHPDVFVTESSLLSLVYILQINRLFQQG